MPVSYLTWDLSIKDRAVVLIYSLGGGITIGYLFYDSMRIGVFISALLLLSQGKYRSFLKERRKGELLLQFRDMLYSISSSVSVGRSMAQAMEESIVFWSATYSSKDYIIMELTQMVKRVKESNEKDISVLKDFAERTGLPDIWDFVNVYESCRDSGANLVQAINRATTIIGDKITLEKELKSLMTQKKFEGKIVTMAPFAMVFMLKVLSPEYLLPLTQTSSGYFITTLALALVGMSYFMTERINNIEI